jgi:hypothetical protein
MEFCYQTCYQIAEVIIPKTQNPRVSASQGELMKVPVQLYVQAKMGDGSHPYLKAAMLPDGHVRPVYSIKAGRALKI